MAYIHKNNRRSPDTYKCVRHIKPLFYLFVEHPAHPVFVRIIHPRKTHALRSQNYDTETPHRDAVKEAVDDAMPCHGTDDAVLTGGHRSPGYKNLVATGTTYARQQP